MGKIGNVQTGKVDYDVEEREAHVIGKGPRVAPLKEEEIEGDGKELVMEIRTLFGMPEDDPLPEATLIPVRNPGVFRYQMKLGIQLVAHGTIPGRERELAVLRIAQLCGAPLEWSEHVDISRRFGVTDEEIERVVEGSSAPGWSEHERAVLRGVEEFIADKCLSDETWDALAKTWNETQLMEFPAVVGSYIMIALQQNTLRIRPKAGLRYR